MSFSDLFGSGEHLRNLSHFAAIVNLASIDGAINPEEEAQLKKFARKLDISQEEYQKVIKNPTAFPITASNSVERRLERLHDLFKIIFADHQIDEEETELIKRYAIGLGFSSQASEGIIERSIQIFSGQLNFEDYRYLLEKEQD
ncbi:TerB family tellurite resistance protein [Salegentibacter chungangensis]|uniref:TerB family tellurite resistance protein n=1 Tax=Salegentibacter chungangensis TaxID=1335724 RepID=A0ABW3NQV3_9FLAO